MNIKKVFLTGIILFFVLGLIAYGLVYRKSIRRIGTKKPNILLVTVCSLRQDHLGCYGYKRNTSPNIDKLAKTSILFQNCYTHIPATPDSIKALITGKYPSTSLDTDKEVKLMELLHSVGYKVFGVMGHYEPRRANLNVGFDQFYGPGDNLETGQDAYTVRANIVVKKALEILKSEKTNNNPIFLWIFFKDPHWKYLPPSPYKEKFFHDALYKQQMQQLNINNNINKDYQNSLRGIGKARLRDSDGKFITNKAYYISQYDAEIAFMDDEFGKIIHYLKQTRRFGDWMIIFVADHGENLGEDEYFFAHGYKLSQSSVKIPLIIKLPEQLVAKVRSEYVSIYDIYPTIADFLGMDTEPYNGNNCGRSILSKKDWLSIIKKEQRKIMLENCPRLESENMKFLGCIWNPYKLIFNITTY